ncbi:diguanylate cyclase [Paucibacter sp. JuS9]|uniref:diguanylate cyclase domain-containing protein n=1 Tax=Roseateles TaxID=93681 RepID=UPI002FE5E9DE
MIAALIHALRTSKKSRQQLAVERDVLDLRVRERTVHLSEAMDFSETIVRASPLPIGVYAEDGQCVRANEAYATLVGGTLKSLLAQNFETTASWKTSGLLATCHRALQSGQPQQLELNTVTTFGKEVWLDCHILPTMLNGKRHVLVQFVDLTERKNLESDLRNLAFQDPLTRIPNRRLLLDRLEHAVRMTKRQNSHGALVFIDLNKFKQLNDTHGHDVGDLLLVEVAKRLRQLVRDSDTVARLGGDEFVALFEGLAADPALARQQAARIEAKVQAALNQDYVLGDIHHKGSASLGTVLFQGDADDADMLLRKADSAMYFNKRGRPA